MEHKNRILIIGAGNIGSAAASCLLANGYSVSVVDRNQGKLQKIQDLTQSSQFSNISELTIEISEQIDLIILAVKPQNLNDLAAEIDASHNCELLRSKLMLSFLAGKSVAELSARLQNRDIVRAMPNIALRVGESMTAWVTTGIERTQKELVKGVLACMGKELELQQEDQLDWFTAISASGPAYFYLLVEILQQKAIAEGFSEEAAELLSRQTFVGATKLLEVSQTSAVDLRAQVTSKGGTTAAAIGSLEEAGLYSIFAKALESAYKRAKELNK